MMLHSYPLLISIYKGEGRMLIVPLIDHIAGYSIDSDWFIVYQIWTMLFLSVKV